MGQLIQSLCVLLFDRGSIALNFSVLDYISFVLLSLLFLSSEIGGDNLYFDFVGVYQLLLFVLALDGGDKLLD